MKKLLLFVVLASLGLVSNAQEEGIRFGAKAGVNFANISGDETDDVDGKTGFHVGAVVEIPLSDKFAFQPELVYSTQGAKSEFTEDLGGGILDLGTTTFEYSTKLNYLNIPLMAKFYPVQGFSIQAGPQIGFLLSGKEKVESSGTALGVSTSASAEEDLENTNGIDFGLNFGLGYQLDMGLFFDGRYNLGLSNIWDIENEEGDFKQQNNVIQLSVGFKF